MLCLCITVLFIWHQVIRNILGAYIGVWFDVVVGSILLLSIFESFFVFSFSLYIAYNKTREQVAMYQALQNSDDPKKMDAILRSIQWSSFLLSNKFAYLWVFGSTAIWMLLVACLTSSVFKLYNTPLAYVDARRVVMPAVLSLLVLGRCLITILCFIVLSFRLRMVQDAFGTKRLLKRLGIGTAISTTIYIFLEPTLAKFSSIGIPYIINTIAANFVLITGFVIPLFEARKAIKMYTVAEESYVANDNKNDFELFLLTEEGFAAFKVHLEEFSVENLLFWKDVNLFQNSCQGDNPTKLNETNVKKAWAIFDKYLSNSAPMEVNLPSASLKKFRGEIFKNKEAAVESVLAATIFNDASGQLVRLMEVNSMERFQKTNPPSWKKFAELREEQKVISQAGELRRTTAAMRIKSQTSRTDDIQVTVRA